MRYLVLVLLITSLFSLSGLAQKPRIPQKSRPSRPVAKPAPSPIKASNEQAEFEKAAVIENVDEKIAALKKFLADFPNGDKKQAASEMLLETMVGAGNKRLEAGGSAGVADLFTSAAELLPTPIPGDLFDRSIGKMPAALFWHGERDAALKVAETLESKAQSDPGQLLEIAKFYINTENANGAKRLAVKAVALAPNSAAANVTLALAHRLNFDLEDSALSYAKALELDPNSNDARRGLADMDRALGKHDEAVALYREILQKDETSLPARTGLVLALFDAGKQPEAEAEMSKALAQNPSNVILMAGAAYWYAANKQPDAAIELAQKAISNEPRYIWSHIALARGLMAKGKPVEAEEALLKARQYGRFPTIDYEIASARMMAGFYRDASDELRRSFSAENGMVTTRLGGQIERKRPDLMDLVAAERRASIFEMAAADDSENSARLKALLEFEQELQSTQPDTDRLNSASDTFISGNDAARLHRELYVASRLLDKKLELDKVLRLADAARGKSDAAVDAPNAASAIMAGELYDDRTLALTRNEFIHIPDVPRQTLSGILRGRIEEIAGSALFYQNNAPEAVIRLKRAVSVMPDKSAWWRSSMWKLGAAYQANGQNKEALDAYIKSYSIDKPDAARYAVVESLYKTVNGSRDGLEAKIGVNPAVQAVSKPAPAVEPTETQKLPEPAASPEQPPVTDVSAKGSVAEKIPVAEATPDATAVVAASPQPTPAAEASPEVIEEKVPAAVSEPKTEPSILPVTSPEPKPVTDTPAAAVSEKPEVKVDVSAEPSASPDVPAEKTAEKVEAKVEPVPVPISSPAASPTPVPVDAEPVQITPTATPASTPSAENAAPPEADVAAAKAEPKPVTDVPSNPSADVSEPKPQPAATEPSPEVTKAVIAPEKTTGGDAKTETKKPLFEPIIITIPAKKPVKLGESRPPDPAPSTSEPEIRKCTIVASQSELSIINDGGSLGLLVGYEEAGDMKELKASSSSPKDIQVTLEPEIAGVEGRSFYVVKSISQNTGVYQVFFEAPCGKKEVVVKVR